MPSDWTILIATLGQRHDRFKSLLSQLLPQLDAHDGRVRVTALYNNGERPLGEVRQDLVDSVTTDYISFVDDDDEVPSYYVDEVAQRLGDVDYVGWRMQCYVDGVQQKPTFHSLQYKAWFENHKGYFRHVSHLNPVRTALARLVNFRNVGTPEDVGWAREMRQHLESEEYIDRIMYYYHASSSDTTWRAEDRPRKHDHWQRHDVDHPYFSYHPASS